MASKYCKKRFFINLIFNCLKLTDVIKIFLAIFRLNIISLAFSHVKGSSAFLAIVLRLLSTLLRDPTMKLST